MLAAAAGDKKRRGERVLAEMLPAGDWRLLADPLNTALRDGLAHGFDTKKLGVGGQHIQIYVSWNQPEMVTIRRVPSGLGVYVGMEPLSQALIAKIDSYESLLKADEEARRKFRTAYDYQRVAPFNASESSAWDRLVKAAGV